MAQGQKREYLPRNIKTNRLQSVQFKYVAYRMGHLQYAGRHAWTRVSDVDGSLKKVRFG